MCTAVSFEHLFGRTLDLDFGYGEEAVLLPRRAKIEFINEGELTDHPAIMGIALMREGVPLWFDAMNEHGVAAAGLSFPEYAVYHAATAGKRNIASFELIPWVLALCKNVTEVKALLQNCNITPDAATPELPPTPMHWMIADREESIVVESVAEGLKVYDNPYGVMTNPPPFPEQTADTEKDLLPGDWSSHSRFLRALYVKKHITGGGDVKDFFHIMDTVAVPNGCSKKDWHTLYTSCADLSLGEYYFSTYENRRISKLSLADAKLDSDTPVSFSMRGGEDMNYCNNR